jgi:hypothetical protein
MLREKILVKQGYSGSHEGYSYTAHPDFRELTGKHKRKKHGPFPTEVEPEKATPLPEPATLSVKGQIANVKRTLAVTVELVEQLEADYEKLKTKVGDML